MICRDLEVANQVSRSTNFDSITLDGDRVDNKGPITGGYHDDRFSKMDAMKGVKDIVGLLEECRASQKAMADELQGIDQEITQCMGEQQRLQARLTHLRGAAEQRRTDERKRQVWRSGDPPALPYLRLRGCGACCGGRKWWGGR